MVTEGVARRNTHQRRVLLEELKKLTSHPTAAQLHEIARRRVPKMSLGTVYRNLELLSDAGVVRKLEIGGGEARFDGDVSQHHHVRCARCGKVDDVKGPPLDVAKGCVDDAAGYEIVGYRLEFIGVCSECGAEQSV